VNEIKDTIELKAILTNFDSFMDFIDSHLANAGVENSDRTKTLTASEEVIVNVINYAYQNENGNLEIIFETNSKSIELTFIDSGAMFNPLEKPDADVTVSLAEREAGGLGILMVKKLMDDVRYEFINNQNRLTVIKYVRE
jgi:serine/threonine-protein kinase RsbW